MNSYTGLLVEWEKGGIVLRRKLLAMLKSCHDVPCVILAQISAAISEIYMFLSISANNADN